MTDSSVADLSSRNTGEAAAEDATLAQSLSELQTEIQTRVSGTLQSGGYLSLARLADLFRLSRFEIQCLVVCLATELDRKYERLYGYLQDDAGRKLPGMDLLLSLLCETPAREMLAARAALDAGAPLLRFKLLQPVEGGRNIAGRCWRAASGSTSASSISCSDWGRSIAACRDLRD